ncbi:MAG: GGDEF domain-containing protein [Micromonosporaceae bacterium]
MRAAARRRAKVTVALADVDGLHAVNANLGHAAGDQYLTAVAYRLTRAVPTGGLLTRLGGDEFVIIATHTSPAELATGIGAAMCGPALVAGHRLQPRASVGIATTDHDPRYALACADTAMYRAKEAGGNHVTIYDPDQDDPPNLDGTRPQVRLRDIDPAAGGPLLWQPQPSEDLLAVIVSTPDARAITEALSAARRRWTQAGAAARHAAGKPAAATAIRPESIDLPPSPSGYQAISDIGEDRAARYARLADRFAAITESADTARTGPPAANTARISSAFTNDEIEALVRTAAEALYEDPDSLSARQHCLAAHAYRLLRADTDRPATTAPALHTHPAATDDDHDLA